MQAEIKRIGNDLVAVLPQELVKKMRLVGGEQVEVTEEKGTLHLSADPVEIPSVMEVFAEMSERYDATLKKLAE